MEPRMMKYINSPVSRRGNNLIEFTFLLPWYVFLFVGALDLGFYAYSLIAVQNAARVGAMYTSSNSANEADSATACSYAIDQLSYMPNVGSSVTSCGGSPITVTAAAATGPDSQSATTVTVSYLTPQLIPIPGLLPGQITVSRAVEMAVRR
jgi:Flp pilus assembly protein TadG